MYKVRIVWREIHHNISQRLLEDTSRVNKGVLSFAIRSVHAFFFKFEYFSFIFLFFKASNLIHSIISGRFWYTWLDITANWWHFKALYEIHNMNEMWPSFSSKTNLFISTQTISYSLYPSSILVLLQQQIWYMNGLICYLLHISENGT